MGKGLSYFNRIAVIILALSFAVMLGLQCVGAESEKPAYTLESVKTEVKADDSNVYSFKEVLGVVAYNETSDENAAVQEATDETATYEFVRKLPEAYKGRIKNVTVEGYDFYFDEDECLIRIQNIEQGKKSFTILYTVNGINNMGLEKDYMDIIFLNGSECTSYDSVKSASLKIKYGNGIIWDKLMFAPGKGGTRYTRYGTWKVNEDDRIITFVNKAAGNHCRLKKGIKVSLTAEFPKGYWANSTEIGWTKTLSMLMLGLGILIFIVMRIIFGRETDIEIRRTSLPPFNMSPLQLGYIYDGYVDDRDITAQLMYMAQKGFWKLREYDRRCYEFEYVRYPEGEDQATKLIFNSVFGERAKPGDVVKLKDAAHRLKKIVPSVRRKTARIFRGGRAAFTTGSKIGNTFIRLAFFIITMILPLMNYTYQMSQKAIMEEGIVMAFGFATVLTFLLSRVSIQYMRLHRKQVNGNNMYFIISAGAYAVVSLVYVYMFRFAVLGRTGDMQVVLTASLFLLIAPLMLFGFRSRSRKAAEIFGGVKGFIEFMRETRGTELMEVAGDDGAYFYRILPYTFQFGISKKVASNFQLDVIPSPDWYEPYGLGDKYDFDVVVMNSMLRNFEHDMINNVFTDTIYYVF